MPFTDQQMRPNASRRVDKGDCNYAAKDPISVLCLTRRAGFSRAAAARWARRSTNVKIQRQNNENCVGRVDVIEVQASRTGPADFDLSITLVENPRVVRIKPPPEEVM